MFQLLSVSRIASMLTSQWISLKNTLCFVAGSPVLSSVTSLIFSSHVFFSRSNRHANSVCTFRVTRSFSRELVTWLYLHIPEIFIRLLFLDRFWFVYIPVVSMAIFLCLAQFTVDHLSHPIVRALVFFS